MFKVSKKLDYGLQILKYLSIQPPKKPVSLAKIAKEQMIPYAFTGQIISQLKKAGLVKSRTGLKGGYFLAKTTPENSLWNIIQTLTEPTTIVQCLSNTSCPKQKSCSLPKFWQQMEEVIQQHLSQKTLNDI